MHFKLGTICLTSVVLMCGVSLAGFAYEAPVVSVDQQQQGDDEASLQADSSSNGGGWQQMASNGNHAEKNQGWQPVQSQNASSHNTENAMSQTVSAQPGSVNARVNRLEQQMSNYTQMNMPQQISDLQQKVGQLQGQVETDQRALQKLTNQQKLYYQDLSQQMMQLTQKEKIASNEANATSEAMKQDKTTTSSTLAEHDSDTVSAQKKSDTLSKPKYAIHQKTHEANLIDNAENEQSDTLALPNQAGAPQLGDADAYGKAFRLLSNKHFDEADTAFQKYLQHYPQGQFAVNAHFWLGEIAMMNQHFNVASKQFQTVVTQYPKSDKVSDAKLKIAVIHAAIGKTNLARKEFENIRKAYPGTTAAQLANIRLQQLANATSVTMQ